TYTPAIPYTMMPQDPPQYMETNPHYNTQQQQQNPYSLEPPFLMQPPGHFSLVSGTSPLAFGQADHASNAQIISKTTQPDYSTHYHHLAYAPSSIYGASSAISPA